MKKYSVSRVDHFVVPRMQMAEFEMPDGATEEEIKKAAELTIEGTNEGFKFLTKAAVPVITGDVVFCRGAGVDLMIKEIRSDGSQPLLLHTMNENEPARVEIGKLKDEFEEAFLTIRKMFSEAEQIEQGYIVCIGELKNGRRRMQIQVCVMGERSAWLPMDGSIVTMSEVRGDMGGQLKDNGTAEPSDDDLKDIDLPNDLLQ